LVHILLLNDLCVSAELEIHVDKMCKYKEENRKLEQTLHSLEQRLKEENMNKIDTTLVSKLGSYNSETNRTGS
jgi:cell division septum initiation protein DivIVA